MGGDVSTDRTGPQPVVVLRALRDLLEQSSLRLSERNRRFLEFVVRETVDGHADRIKAYTIGVDVFGRDPNFDPAVDPIVRIEANRVRSALARYYETAGRHDQLRIGMPPGSYVPTFALVELDTAADAEGPVASTRADLEIVVRDRSGNRSGRSVSRTSLRRDLFANAVLRTLGHNGFKVFWVPQEADIAAARCVGERLVAGRCLDLAVHELGFRRRFSWRLWETGSGAILVCDHRDLEARSTPDIELIDGIARAAVLSIVALAARH